MEAASKKRKRKDKELSNSRKKIALEAAREESAKPNPKVSILSNQNGSWEPVIASARGVSMPKGLSFTPYIRARSNLPQRPGQTNVQATELLLHSDENVKMDYTAREEDSGDKGALLKHYIGVYDPETEKFEIVEARPMVFRGAVKFRQADASSMVANQEHLNVRDQRNALGQTFGTKKAKGAIADQIRNTIHIEGSTSNLSAASKVVFDSMAEATSKMPTRDELQEIADDAKPRPQANLEATKLADAYPIDTLFDLSTIPVKDWHDSLIANKEITTSSRFVSSRLNKVKLADNNVDTQKLKVLRYLLCLLEVNSSTIQKGRVRMLTDRTKLGEKLRLPLPVVESVRRKFSEAGIMTKHHGDLLITTICVLALIVDNFEIDSTMSLRDDLKLDTKPMDNYFLEVGAKVTAPPAAFIRERGLSKAESKQHHSAKLKLPLAFPKVRVARSRNRRDQGRY